MKISTKGRYAIRLMLDIAEYDTGEPVSIRDISRRQDVSVKYLEQIVPGLVRAGYLRSVRGPQGGYLLTRDPSEYTAGDILRVTEGNLAPVECLQTEENPCTRADTCTSLLLWKKLKTAIEDVVDNCTLEEMLSWSRSAENNFVI